MTYIMHTDHINSDPLLVLPPRRVLYFIIQTGSAQDKHFKWFSFIFTLIADQHLMNKIGCWFTLLFSVSIKKMKNSQNVNSSTYT